MLDPKIIRQNPTEVQQKLKARNFTFDCTAFEEMDQKRLALLSEAEDLKAQRNGLTKQIGRAKKNSPSDAQRLMDEVRMLGNRIESLDQTLLQLDSEYEALLSSLPNLPHPSVPIGTDEHGNVLARSWGTPRFFEWEPKTAADIGKDLRLIERGSTEKAEEAAIPVYCGVGARLKRALTNFLMDYCAENGYTEMLTPYSAYHHYRHQILEGSSFPVHHCGCCSFYADASFQLTAITARDRSNDDLELITSTLEKVLQLLRLPYRIVTLCSGQLDFNAAKTYRIDVWMPSLNRYLKIATCTNYETYLSRREEIRYREKMGDKPHYACLLLASLSIDHTLAALLETEQHDDGSVAVPDALIPYTNCTIIR